MADLVLLAVVVGFFSLMVLLVQACDRIIGPDGPDLLDGGHDAADEVRPAAEEVPA